MNIACITYREWAVDIYEKIYSVYNDRHNFLIWRDKHEYDEIKLLEFKPDIILWYGWSWIVKDVFVNEFISIMLHPSPLPKYRGGSPIQNQIINGEKLGAVTLIKMNEGLDKGDIFQQLPMSLEGSLEEIFERISSLGFASTCNIIEGNFNLTKQDNSISTYFKRRTKDESEITLDEFKDMPAEYLYNKIRMLADPYPNAFFKTADGRKLIFKNVEID
jgi:methionyl-tRNA formyltransferase